MKPIGNNILVKKLENRLDLEGLEEFATSKWKVLAKGKDCRDDYKEGDIIECYAKDELPRESDKTTFVLKDICVLGVCDE